MYVCMYIYICMYVCMCMLHKEKLSVRDSLCYLLYRWPSPTVFRILILLLLSAKHKNTSIQLACSQVGYYHLPKRLHVVCHVC